MISHHEGPPDAALAQSLARLQARAYASTGMRPWDAREISALMENPCTRLYISRAEDTRDTSLNAFMLATFIAGEAEILSLAVDPQYFRAGIGSRLVEAIVHDCESAEIEFIILEVAETNRPALSLYISSGFVKVGKRKGYYTLNGCRIDAHVLRKHITVD